MNEGIWVVGLEGGYCLTGLPVVAGGRGAASIIPFQQMISTRSRAMRAAACPSGASSQTMRSMESNPATVKGAGLPNSDESAGTAKGASRSNLPGSRQTP